MNRRNCLTLLAAGLLTACTPAPGGSGNAEAPAGAAIVAPGDTTLALERTPCFGFCPTYRLALDSTGRGVLEGQAPGAGFRRALQVPAESLRALLDRMEQGGFFQFDSAYIPGHPLCVNAATDHPGAVITVVRGGRRQQVRHYHGCYAEVRAEGPAVRPPVLAQLIAFEDAIDSLAGVGAWVDSLRGR